MIISTNEKNLIYLCGVFSDKLGSYVHVTGWKSSALNLASGSFTVDLDLTAASRGKMMSTSKLLEGRVLILEYHKLNTMFLTHVPTVF